MANLAVVTSTAVNGVASLHTEILKTRIFPLFDRLFPGKIQSITNGITPRRWLKVANPFLSSLITETIGDGWVTNLEELRKLEPFAEDEAFREAWANVKTAQKLLLKREIERESDLRVKVDSLFDSQVKRFHLYKRQLLNALHMITLYNRIRRDPGENHLPRTIVVGGKAAPAYVEAKLVIKLINSIADVVNRDPAVKGLLQIVFMPNYSVALAEKIIPATELSEQISTAGYEASGTGNMKLALNGALTIGTLDGANIEIMDEVGRENMFIFGLNADEVARRHQGGYRPRDFYEQDAELREVIDMIEGGYFNPDEPGIFGILVQELLERDFFCLLADYSAYIKAQLEVESVYRNSHEWTRRSILNVARIGRFSSDRSIAEYNRQIWRVEPVAISEERFGSI